MLHCFPASSPAQCQHRQYQYQDHTSNVKTIQTMRRLYRQCQGYTDNAKAIQTDNVLYPAACCAWRKTNLSHSTLLGQHAGIYSVLCWCRLSIQNKALLLCVAAAFISKLNLKVRSIKIVKRLRQETVWCHNNEGGGSYC